ncbi:hypothetical protein J6590_066395 [Homalodisca vitripennis]|nr:hypothetical protein J6590_066395 [Homalodisca vitripennis]
MLCWRASTGPDVVYIWVDYYRQVTTELSRTCSSTPVGHCRFAFTKGVVIRQRHSHPFDSACNENLDWMCVTMLSELGLDVRDVTLLLSHTQWIQHDIRIWTGRTMLSELGLDVRDVTLLLSHTQWIQHAIRIWTGPCYQNLDQMSVICRVSTRYMSTQYLISLLLASFLIASQHGRCHTVMNYKHLPRTTKVMQMIMETNDHCLIAQEHGLEASETNFAGK